MCVFDKALDCKIELLEQIANDVAEIDTRAQVAGYLYKNLDSMKKLKRKLENDSE